MTNDKERGTAQAPGTLDRPTKVKFIGITGGDEYVKLAIVSTETGKELSINGIRLPNVVDYKIVLSSGIPIIELQILLNEISGDLKIATE